MASDSIKKAVFANVIDNKAIVIAGTDDKSKLRLLGTTMTANVRLTPRFECEKSIILYPNKGEDGIVALCVAVFDGWTGGKYSHERYVEHLVFLKVSWAGEGDETKPRIDLDTQWYPAERIGTITPSTSSEHGLEVVVCGKRVTSKEAPRSADKHEDIVAYCLDGNLLCRYLWGTAKAHEVLHAAVEQRREPTAQKRVEELTRELRILRSEVHSLRLHFAFVGDLLDQLVSKNNVLRTYIRDLGGLWDWLPRWLRPKTLNGVIEAAMTAQSHI